MVAITLYILLNLLYTMFNVLGFASGKLISNEVTGFHTVKVRADITFTQFTNSRNCMYVINSC